MGAKAGRNSAPKDSLKRFTTSTASRTRREDLYAPPFPIPPRPTTNCTTPTTMEPPGPYLNSQRFQVGSVYRVLHMVGSPKSTPTPPISMYIAYAGRSHQWRILVPKTETKFTCLYKKRKVFHQKVHFLRKTFTALVRRDDWIRTSDHAHPMRVRYQTAPHPDSCSDWVAKIGIKTDI